MAVKTLGVNPGIAWWIILPLTVWWIYLADHLIDGFRWKENTKNPRHLYFYQNRQVLILIILLISMLDIVLIWLYLPLPLILFGGVAGLMVLVYLAGVHFINAKNYLVFPKEIFVAFLYVIGIWGGPMFLTHDYEKGIFPMIGFFLITLSNLFIYSYFEKEQDSVDGQISIFAPNEKKRYMYFLFGWIILSLLYTLIISITSEIQSATFYCMMIFIVMLIAQMFLVYKASWFSINSRYRWMNEGIFLLPALMLFYS